MSDTVNIAHCPVHGLHGERTTCFAFEHEGCRDCDGVVQQVAMVPLDSLREWIETRRAWTATAGRSPSERTRGHLFVLEALSKWLSE